MSYFETWYVGISLVVMLITSGARYSLQEEEEMNDSVETLLLFSCVVFLLWPLAVGVYLIKGVSRGLSYLIRP